MTLGHDPVGFVAELGPGALLGNRLMNVDAGHVGGPIGRPHASWQRRRTRQHANRQVDVLMQVIRFGEDHKLDLASRKVHALTFSPHQFDSV
jgi:hypothetical protein